MSEILEEFWIFSKDGEPLVNFYRDSNIKGFYNYRNVSFDQEKLKEIKDLIMLNLQNSSTKKKKIMKFEDNFIRYGQCLQNDLIIFYKTKPDIKEKIVLTLCKVISGILEDVYPIDKLQFWDGNLSFFEKFKKRIALYFKMSTL
ncbi:MAG: hypothetical protein ACFE8G_10075 [Candidatus Hermodarchaeota archaeon]